MKIIEESAPRFESQYKKRRTELRRSLIEAGLDALLITQPANRFYLSGFELHDSQPDESSGCLVISADGTDWLATDSRYQDAAARLWPSKYILIYKYDRARDIANLLKRCGAVIGFESRGVSWKLGHELIRMLPLGHRIFAADGLVENLRMIKQPEEIAALEKSFRLNHAMMEWVEGRLKEHDSSEVDEKTLAWEIEKFFREKGAQELAFSTITAIGKNSCLPHAIPGTQLLGNNVPVLVDAGCRVDFYCSDQTRTFWHGDVPSSEFKKNLQLVREAQEAALAIMRPGVACADVYRVARDVFVKAGVEKAFTHGLGHGVGLQTHEGPTLSPRSKQILEANMVVTVEPGLYYREWGGVRWEYTVIVEKDGVRIL